MRRAGSEHARHRIIAIAESIVASRIQAGDVNPRSKIKLRKAVREAVTDAMTIYRAAEEFLGG